MPGEASTAEVLVWLIRPLLLAYCWYLGAARFVSLAKSMGMNPKQEREMKREYWRVFFALLAGFLLKLLSNWLFGRGNPFPEFFGDDPPAWGKVFIVGLFVGLFLPPLALVLGVELFKPWANSQKVGERLMYWPVGTILFAMTIP